MTKLEKECLAGDFVVKFLDRNHPNWKDEHYFSLYEKVLTFIEGLD